jgi:hypothetical protein
MSRQETLDRRGEVSVRWFEKGWTNGILALSGNSTRSQGTTAAFDSPGSACRGSLPFSYASSAKLRSATSKREI